MPSLHLQLPKLIVRYWDAVGDASSFNPTFVKLPSELAADPDGISDQSVWEVEVSGMLGTNSYTLDAGVGNI